MRSLAIIAIAAEALSLTLPACNTSGCVNNQSAIPLAGFYDSSTGESASLAILDIHGVGAPNDSLALSAGSSSNKVYLPMRSGYQSVSWCLHYTQEDLENPRYNDTITFDYESIPYFASEECGAMYYYNITRMKHTSHLVDSVVISDSLITNVDIERIRIYFRIAAEEQPETPDRQ